MHPNVQTHISNNMIAYRDDIYAKILHTFLGQLNPLALQHFIYSSLSVSLITSKYI